MNATAGLNEGIYNTLGAPVDALTWALNQGIRGVNAVAGSDVPQIKEPVGGSKSISKAFGAVGVPEPETVQATTTGERIARGLGEGVGYTVAPELGGAALARAGLAEVTPRAAEAIGQAFGRSQGAADFAGNAAAGAGAGAGLATAATGLPRAAIAKSNEASLLTKILLAAGTAGGAALDGLSGGLIGLLGMKTVSGMRQAGAQRIDDIVKDAMLDPEMARTLLAKAPVRPDNGLTNRLADRFRKAAAAGAVVSIGER